MTFQELLAEVRKLDREEARADLTHYAEIVVGAAALGAVEALLRAYFGEPVKANGQLAPPELAARVRPFGGIQPDQIMYFRQGDIQGEFACLWPWSNGRSITVKVIAA